MSVKQTALLVAALLAAIGVLADYFLKLSSDHAQSMQSKWFWVGLTVYAGMAGGWVYVMRHLSFTEIGIVYSVTTILLLTVVGALVLRETLHAYEVVGVLMAVGSLVLLARFS